MATLLLNSAAKGDLPTVKKLLRGGVLVTEMDLHGRTALLHAENGTISMLFPPIFVLFPLSLISANL
jgi:hypothetical protein